MQSVSVLVLSVLQVSHVAHDSIQYLYKSLDKYHNSSVFLEKTGSCIAISAVIVNKVS